MKAPEVSGGSSSTWSAPTRGSSRRRSSTIHTGQNEQDDTVHEPPMTAAADPSRTSARAAASAIVAVRGEPVSRRPSACSATEGVLVLVGSSSPPRRVEHDPDATEHGQDHGGDPQHEWVDPQPSAQPTENTHDDPVGPAAAEAVQVGAEPRRGWRSRAGVGRRLMGASFMARSCLHRSPVTIGDHPAGPWRCLREAAGYSLMAARARACDHRR